MTKIVQLISKTAPKWLKLILSMALVFNSATLAHAEIEDGSSSKEAEKKIKLDENKARGIPMQRYLNSCEGLLEAMQTGKVESFFLDQSQNEAQLTKLLYDYGLIFSQEYDEALSAVLKSRGFVKITGQKSLEKYIVQVRALMKSSNQQFDELNQAVLEKIAVRMSGLPTQERSRVAHLKVTQMIEAIQNSDHKEKVFRLLEVTTRFSLLTTIKSAINKRNDLSESMDGMRGPLPVALALTGMAGGAVIGGLSGFWLSDNLVEPYLGWNVLSFLTWAVLTFGLGIGGGAAGLFGGGFTGITLNNLALLSSPLNLKMSSSEDVELDYLAIEANTEFILDGLLEDYESGIKDGLLTLEQACETSVCEMTPVQIAYLGHIEIQEIKAAVESASNMLGTLNLVGALDALQEKARAVIESPDAFDRQFQLLRSVELFERDFSYDPQRSKSAASLLAEKVTAVRELINTLSKKPFSQSTLELHEEDVRKSEMILLKLKSDLKQLHELELEQNRSYTLLKKLRPMLVKIADTRPADPDANLWSEYSEQVILLVDQMRALE